MHYILVEHLLLTRAGAGMRGLVQSAPGEGTVRAWDRALVRPVCASWGGTEGAQWAGGSAPRRRQKGSRDNDTLSTAEMSN